MSLEVPVTGIRFETLEGTLHSPLFTPFPAIGEKQAGHMVTGPLSGKMTRLCHWLLSAPPWLSGHRLLSFLFLSPHD